MTTLTVTLGQMSIFFLFMIAGFLLYRTGKLGKGASDTVSVLLLTLFMPATCYRTFAAHCTPSVLSAKWGLILAGFVTLLACLLISFLLSRVITDRAPMRKVIVFALTVSNLGYVGYPLTEAVFGEAVLFDFMVFTMPFNLYIYSFGMAMFNPDHRITPRIFLTPTILAILAGMAVGLSGITLPSPLVGAVDVAAACLAPCAMLVTGLVLAESPLSDMLKDLRAYLISALRLVGLPALFAILALAVRLDPTVARIGTTMLCLPAGLNCVVFARSYGGESAFGARVCFLSALLGMITIPLIYAAATVLFPL